MGYLPSRFRRCFHFVYSEAALLTLLISDLHSPVCLAIALRLTQLQQTSFLSLDLGGCQQLPSHRYDTVVQLIMVRVDRVLVSTKIGRPRPGSLFKRLNELPSRRLTFCWCAC